MAALWAKLGSRVRRPGFDRFLVPAVLVAFSLARAGRFEERDPYWQARAGMENLAGWPLARPDTWTWSGVEGLWYQNSPLWNSLLGLGYQSGGFWGFFAVTAATMCVYFGLVYLLALRLGARRLPALAGILIAALPALAMLSPRGTLAAEIILIGSILVAVELARTLAATLALWKATALVVVAAGALSVLGNWLHLSFLMFSLLLAGLWGVIWLLAPIGARRKVMLTIGGAAGWLTGIFLSPYGLAVTLERTRVVQQVCDELILEWNSPFRAGTPTALAVMGVVAVVLVIISAVTFLLSVRNRPWGPAESGCLVVLMVSAPTAFAGLFAIRFLGVSLLTLAPMAAVAATLAVDAFRRRQRVLPASRWREYSTGGFWRVVVTTTLVVFLPMVGHLVSLHAVPDETEAISRLPQGCNLFSSGGLSAVAILTRLDSPVWIDGRADFFGREHLIRTYSFFELGAPTLIPEGAGCILLNVESDDSRQLAAAIEASADWQQTYSSGRFRIWVPAKA